MISGAKASNSKLSVSIASDATPDLKKAVEVCEYAIKVTNGETSGDVIPISVRYPLLQTWVRAKQMLQSNINKGYGTDDEVGFYGFNGVFVIS